MVHTTIYVTDLSIKLYNGILISSAPLFPTPRNYEKKNVYAYQKKISVVSNTIAIRVDWL